MRAQLLDFMSQVGSNFRLSQLHPLRPSHTDQSQGSKLSLTDRHTEFPLVEVPQTIGCGF